MFLHFEETLVQGHGGHVHYLACPCDWAAPSQELIWGTTVAVLSVTVQNSHPLHWQGNGKEHVCSFCIK